MARPMYVKVSDIQKDDDQIRIYNLNPDSRYVVSGCAGSGKSSLALLFLEQILGRGEDDSTPNQIYYVATVHELVECVRKQFSRFSSPPRYNDYAITGAAWKDKTISDLQRRGQNRRGPFLIRGRKCMETKPHGYNNSWIDLRINPSPDYLLIDEAQDFDLASIMRFSGAAKKGCVFYGDDSQKIIKNGTNLDTICQALGIPRYHLKRNWRLSKAIARFAQSLPGQQMDEALVRRCRGEYDEKPFVVGKNTEDEIKQYIFDRCAKATIDDDIGIVLRSNRKIREWYDYLNDLLPGKVSARYSYEEISPWGFSESHYDYLRETPIKILRYEDAKGQQFRDVFLIADDSLMTDSESLSCFYVGVTRAERYLYVLYTGSKPAFLENVDPDLYAEQDVAETPQINF